MAATWENRRALVAVGTGTSCASWCDVETLVVRVSLLGLMRLPRRICEP